MRNRSRAWAAWVCVVLWGCSGPPPEAPEALPVGSAARLVGETPLLGRTIAAGTRVRVVRDRGNTRRFDRLVRVRIEEGPARAAETGVYRSELEPLAGPWPRGTPPAREPIGANP